MPDQNKTARVSEFHNRCVWQNNISSKCNTKKKNVYIHIIFIQSTRMRSRTLHNASAESIFAVYSYCIDSYFAVANFRFT